MSTLALFLTAKAMVYLVIALFVGLINSISIIVIQCYCINDANNNNILKSDTVSTRGIASSRKTACEIGEFMRTKSRKCPCGGNAAERLQRERADPHSANPTQILKCVLVCVQESCRSHTFVSTSTA
uniref:Uncharacterized protein n=1 Tax=Physcomitrium patens TaxID=3218 RepID=A0A2K1L305_PHYPA|nr:hypothetical protein PHYPA_003200 [Physcomitrium patens]